ncbi:hypothetical protein ACF0H5_006870 [Mactra antiquata]
MIFKGIIAVLCLSLTSMNVECLPERELTIKNWFSKLIGKCLYEGKFYNIGQKFDERYDALTNTMHYKQCMRVGSVYGISIPNYMTTSTTPQTTTKAPGCKTDDGRYYAPGEEISRGQDGNWCYGTFCGDDGTLMAWDNFNCGSTTPTTTMPTTTSPRAT